MKVVKKCDVVECDNSKKCKVLEYHLDDNDIDIAIAIITGRYPDSGYSLNEECKELVYVLEGSGKLNFENETILFNKGDTILINPKEKYYFDSDYCKVSTICTPKWNIKQYKIVK